MLKKIVWLLLKKSAGLFGGLRWIHLETGGTGATLQIRSVQVCDSLGHQEISAKHSTKELREVEQTRARKRKRNRRKSPQPAVTFQRLWERDEEPSVSFPDFEEL